MEEQGSIALIALHLIVKIIIPVELWQLLKLELL